MCRGFFYKWNVWRIRTFLFPHSHLCACCLLLKACLHQGRSYALPIRQACRHRSYQVTSLDRDQSDDAVLIQNGYQSWQHLSRSDLTAPRLAPSPSTKSAARVVTAKKVLYSRTLSKSHIEYQFNLSSIPSLHCSEDRFQFDDKSEFSCSQPAVTLYDRL